MTAAQRRLWIAVDEWLGVALLIYLRRYDPAAFPPALVAWLVAVYGISYPWHWLLLWRGK